MVDRRIQVTLSAVDKTKAAFRSVGRSLSNIGSKVKEFGAQIGIAFGVGGGTAVAGLKAFADELTRTLSIAERLGTTTEELSKLAFAAKTAGVDLDTLQDGLQDFAERVSEAKTGTGEAAEALDELGLNAAELAALPLEERVRAYADALSQYGDQADKIRLNLILFGDEVGGRLTPLLSRGGQAFEQAARRAEELGAVVGTDSARAAKEFSLQLTELNTQLNAVGRSITEEILPPATFLATVLNEQSLTAGFLKIAEIAGRTAGGIEGIRREMDELQAAIDQVNDTFADFSIYGEKGEILAGLQEQFDRVRQEYRKSINELIDDREKAGEKQVEVEETIRERLLRAWNEGLNAQEKTYEDYVKSLADLAEEDIRIKEMIANAGRELASSAESVQLGRELDPGDLFIRLQQGFRQLAAGDTAGAKRTIEAIVDAMRTLTEESRSFGDTITAQQIRDGLDELRRQIIDVQKEKLIDSAQAEEDAKNATEAVEQEFAANPPQVAVEITQESLGQIRAAVQAALDGEPFEATIVPRATEVLPGVFETSPGEFGSSPYPSSVGEGHETP